MLILSERAKELLADNTKEQLAAKLARLEEMLADMKENTRKLNDNIMDEDEVDPEVEDFLNGHGQFCWYCRDRPEVQGHCYNCDSNDNLEV